MHKDYPDIDARLLVKLHRGKNELTRSEKIFNKNPCRVRIRIENSLADVKKFQVLSQPYRHSLHYYNPPCRFVANSANFRMRQRSKAPLAHAKVRTMAKYCRLTCYFAKGL
jgi:hypothetical protein